MKILICTPCFGGKQEAAYSGSLLQTLIRCAKEHIEAEVFFLENESSISRARNNCAGYFLRGDYDKLFFIDADQGWTPEDFIRIARSERAIIGGTYAKRTLPIDLNFSPLEEHLSYFPGGSKPPEKFYEYAKLADASGEIPVSKVPTGFLCIRREVFEKLQDGCPSYLAKDNQHAEEFRFWDFFPSGVLNGSYESEDWFFCLQAKEAGFQPYLSVRTTIDHVVNFRLKVPQPPQVPA